VITFPVKLATSPLIDAMGKSAWDNMLRRTENIYPSQLPVTPQKRATRQRGAVREEITGITPALPYFMKRLTQADPSERLQITLVGHSMGTILLDRLVRDSRLKFTNIVYLAAATTIQDFQLQAADYLKKHPDTKFYNASLHPVAESREMNFFDLPPRGSLLEWIDNFLSTPLNVNDRTLGKWDNLFEVNPRGHYEIDELIHGMADKQMNFKAYNAGHGSKPRPPGYQWVPPGQTISGAWKDMPQKHGDFSDMPFWDPKFWEPETAK
jgi:hypothetical protein